MAVMLDTAERAGGGETAPIVAGYRPLPGIHDEMMDRDGRLRPHWEPFLAMLGARVRLIAPRTLLPAEADRFGVEIFTDMKQGLAGADIVMMLRLQLERMTGAFIPSAREYNRVFGISRERLDRAKRDILILHPGPMNRGGEIDSAVADGPWSVILDQVANGVAVRMAVLYLLAGGESEER